MEQEQVPPVTKAEALAALQEIDRVILLTRQTIARAGSAPIVIMWGIIWMVGYTCTQFLPDQAGWFWTVLDIGGIMGSFAFRKWSAHSPVKNPNSARIGISWLVLIGFGVIWLFLLRPWQGAKVSDVPDLGHRISAYWATVPMFAYVIMGLWLDRFFIWLGAIVTIATVAGYIYIGNYFYLWMAVVGGGSLVVGGAFIKKFWK
jgi:hypothetical protein